MTPANLPHRPKSLQRQGRPGTIRAIIGSVGLILIGVATITGLRMAEAQNTSEASASASMSNDRFARVELAAPPAPGTFGIAEHTSEAQITLASDTSFLLPDCVKELERILEYTTVSFDKGSADIGTQNVPLLTRISEEIIACDEAYVMVAGHADGSGDDAINLALSWERADRTLNRLLALGVDPYAVEAIGFGARAPLAQGSSSEDEADRRVDFRVLRKP